MSAARSYYKLMTRRGAKRGKYGNKKVEIDGRKFDSVSEADRWSQLRIRERIGEIIELECQPAFPIVVNDQKIATYKGDFRYRVVSTNAVVVEDVKVEATKTPLYRIKKKLVEAIHGVVIVEIEGRSQLRTCASSRVRSSPRKRM
jgi:hypothetical protein